MRWPVLLLVPCLCLGAPAKKPSPPDKLHLSLNFSRRNGLAFPGAGSIGLVSAPLLGGAALAGVMGGLKRLGGQLNQLFSGQEAGLPKTTGETERAMTSPEADQLIALASTLPLSCSAEGTLEAELVWDADRKAYVVETGRLVWSGRNNSRFQTKDHLLYCKISGGGTHQLKREEVVVKFPAGNLAKAAAATRGRSEVLTYDLDIKVEMKEQPLTGEGGWIAGDVFAIREKYAGGATSTDIKSPIGSDSVTSGSLMFALPFSYSAEEREIRNGNASFTETWTSPGGTQEMIHWTFNPPRVEVDVETDKAFDDWIPEGSLDSPGQQGNTVKVHAVANLRGTEGGTGKAKIEFRLRDVSKEKGVCTNWPLKGAKIDDGLRLRVEDNPDLEPITGGGGKVVGFRTRGLVSRADLVISSHDYGAYGVLAVEAKDADGNDAKVRVRGEEKPDLAVPLDENHNHVADAWERKYAGGLAGQETDDKDDAPAGKSGCDGDGLGLYEEYRGFRVTGGPETATGQCVTGSHVRTDPRKKDLFVCDRTAGRLGGPGVGHFASATGLAVHRLAPEELGEDRVVNPNGGLGHVTVQHGLVLKDGPSGSDPEQIPADPNSTTFGPPVLTAHVNLPGGGAFSSGDGLADVAHELSHAVGLRHHGDGLEPVEWYWELSPDGAWRLMEQAIVGVDVQTGRTTSTTQWKPNPAYPPNPITVFYEPPGKAAATAFKRGDPPPAGSATVGVDRWRLFIGRRNSQFAGDQECLMRYYDKQAFFSRQDPAHTRYLPDKHQWKMRNRLCEDGRGTGVNAPDHAPQSRYGDAAEGAGNCRGQLVINDKYAGK